MAAGRFEIGAIALGHLVDVDGVFAGREVFEVQLNNDALGASAGDGGRADACAFAVFHLNDNFGCFLSGGRHHAKREDRQYSQGCFHGSH